MKDAWAFAEGLLQHGKRVRVTVEEAEEIRTLDQNSVFWCKVNDIAAQVQWQVDGRMEWLDPAEWKLIFWAAIHKELRVARGINGGHVMLGGSTKRMGKKIFHEMTEFAQFFGDERGVQWTSPK
jgi:hypothetical protein